MTAIDNDWRECIKIEQHLYVMTNKANISRFYSNCMMGVNVFTVTLYYLGDFALHLVKDYNETLRKLPLQLQLPFKTNQSPIFESFFVIIFLLVITNAFTIAVLNGMILSVVSIKLSYLNCNINQFLIRSPIF